jgi:hypothetical protein
MLMEKDVQRDTIVVRDTFHYTKEKIVTKKVLVEKPCTVYVQATDTIYKDSICYVALPRQYYFSKVGDVEIYHSGIDSTIDSLNVVSNITNIANITQKPKNFKHTITAYGSVGCRNTIVVAPCGVRYLYHPKRWLGVGGKYEYDFINKTHSVLATTEINIGW